jgi:predicted MFS family arabinose efflux permease
VALGLATRFVGESWDTSGRRRIDVAGLALATCSLLPLTFVLIKGYEIGWRSPISLGLLALSALSASAFVFVERRIPEPVFDLSLLRRGPFSATTIVTFVIGVAWFGAFLFTSLFLQQVRHDSPVMAGAALLPWLGTLLIIAPVTGRLAEHLSPRLLVTIGLMLLAAGFFLLSCVDAASGYPALIPGLLLGGIGAALTIPLNGLALASVDGRKAGVASGIFNTARETGGCLGIALTSAIVAYGKESSAAAGFSREHAFAVGYSHAMVVAAVLTLGAASVTLLALRPQTAPAIPLPRAASPAEESMFDEPAAIAS